MADERASIDQVGRYWDAVVRGDVASAELDADLAAAIHRMHALAAPPPPAARERVWQKVLTAAEASSVAQNGRTPIAGSFGGNVRPTPGAGLTLPGSIGGRRNWLLAQLATAALLLVTLVGSFYAFGPGRYNRQQEPPALIPAIVATPATPEPAETPVAEFLWQSQGDSDLPLDDPSNLAIDPQGNIWVTDGRNSRFQIFSPDGELLEVWGTPGEGAGELDFVEPMLFGGYGAGSMAFDAEGNLFVADPGNYRIQKFGPDRSFLTAWGQNGLGDGQFLAILNLAIDGQGRVYVTDETRGDVQLFDGDGRFLSVWSDSAEGWLGKPSVIEIDADGNLWFTHFQMHAVQKYAPDGTLLASWGERGFEEGQLNNPAGLSIDGQGRVYVNEWANDRIQVFNPDGTHLAAWGASGTGEGQFMGLNGSILDGDGNIYVVEDGTDRIQKFRLLPPIAPQSASVGTAPDAVSAPVAEFVWATEGGPGLPLDIPYKVEIDPSGNLWVADGGNHRFQIFAPDGTFLETWGTPGGGDGQFNFRIGGYGYGAVVWDTAGNLYVADSGNDRIQKFAPDRSFLTAWGTGGSGDGQFLGLNDLAVDERGHIYATDHVRHDVQIFDGNGRFLESWGGYGSDAGQFTNPGGIALDAAGNVYIVEYHGHRVQVLSPEGTVLASWGKSGTDEGEFLNPTDVTLDGHGRVFVTDAANRRIQVFAQNGDFLAAWGHAGLDEGEFRSPTSISLDGNGFAYVSDEDADRVQKFRLLPSLAPG